MDSLERLTNGEGKKKENNENELNRQNALNLTEMHQIKLRNNNKTALRNTHGVSKTVLGIRTTSLPPPLP